MISHAATCPNCRTSQGVDDPRDGVDTQPCGECRVGLCRNCPQFRCDGCNLAHCAEHRTTLGDQEFCRACMAEAAGLADVETVEQQYQEVS